MEWNHFLSKLLSISKIGLKFSKDPYALENYQELQDLVILQSQEVNQPIDVVKLYPKDTYPTPNVSVRIIIFNDKRELYKSKPTMISEYVMYFLAEIKGGTLQFNHELLDIGFFDYDALPVLSLKTSKRELDIAMDVIQDRKEVYFD